MTLSWMNGFQILRQEATGLANTTNRARSLQPGRGGPLTFVPLILSP
jgi:hypothetical protein